MFIPNQRHTLIALAIMGISSLAIYGAPKPKRTPMVENLGPLVNTPLKEYAPVITPDEKYLFFESDRQPSTGPKGDNDLWFSKNTAKTRGVDEPVFEKPAPMGSPINTDKWEGQPSLRALPDGGIEMFFSSVASERRSGPALSNLYHAIWRNGKWLEPVPLTELNTDFHDRMPAISVDGQFLFFSSDRPGGKGGDDIWVSKRDNASGQWGEPKNVAAINSESSEITPSLHSNGKMLYFSSNAAGGLGGYDLYVTKAEASLSETTTPDLAGEAWLKPENLGTPFNSEFDDQYPSVIASGQRLYFVSNRPGGQGLFDIYRARLPALVPTATEIKTAPPAKTGLRFLGRVYFLSDTHDKTVGDEENFLQLVAQRMKLHPESKLFIFGHGDSRGTVSFNKHLGKLRAEFVKSQLIAKGIRASRIRLHSAGKSRLRYPRDNNEFKKQKNRRADIFITVASSDY